MIIRELKEYKESYYDAVLKMIKELTGRHPDMTSDQLQEIIASENSYLFLLESEDDVIGMLTIGVYKSPTGSKAWIEDVVVMNDHRGRGYGRTLVEYAIKFSEKLGVQTLMLTSRPTRIAANALYKSLGFEKRDTNVYKIIIR